MFTKYDEVIQSQLKEGILEKVTSKPVGKEYYLPHRAVIREEAESSQVRVVCDGSAKSGSNAKSLNGLLETGPPLQNLLWDILLRSRVAPVLLCGDMKQAFLQIRVREEDRDSLRFHWLKDKNPRNIEVLRFTRPIFGLVQSPFILNGTLKVHLTSSKEEFPERKDVIEKIEEDLYVDDIITGGNDVNEVIELKDTMKDTFKAAGFELHKWHSNKKILETDLCQDTETDSSETYAKRMLAGGGVEDETTILGLSWEKVTDCLAVKISKGEIVMTKHGVLRFLASIFDPTGIYSPVILMGKLFYREACDLKLSWDENFNLELKKSFLKWFDSLPEKVEVPRSLARFEGKINSIDLHVFADASIEGVCAAIYGVINQVSGSTTGLFASKSRLAKRDQSTPKLELVGVHMASNITENTKNALKRYPVENYYGWTDSTVVLHWLRNCDSYKPFVSNRVSKIREKRYLSWRHVPTAENPADYGSRGCTTGDKLPTTWFHGPPWLNNKSDWPKDIVTSKSSEPEAEVKTIKTVLAAAVVEKKDEAFGTLLDKFDLWKCLRIMSWLARFVNNCRRAKVKGNLGTEEINDQLLFFIRKAQEQYEHTDEFKKDQLSLNLQRNKNGLYECRGRIQGSYPLYLPPTHPITERIATQCHLRTLHGGVGLTMTEIRRCYWVPRLRQLVKRIRHNCKGCKRFHAISFANPPPGNLPVDRVEGSRAFQVIGVDFAGPIIYHTKNKKEANSYILLFTCSLSRAVFLELLTDQTAESFIRCLKRFVARRGRPVKIYSDNAMAFKKAANWLYKIMKCEKLNDFTAREDIKWQFNLSRAP